MDRHGCRGVCIHSSVCCGHRAPVRSVTAPVDTRSLRKSFSALMSCTTCSEMRRDRFPEMCGMRMCGSLHLRCFRVNLPELSSHPWVWSRSSGACSGGSACCNQTLPGSPGHTSAKPSPRHWHPASEPSVDHTLGSNDLRQTCSQVGGNCLQLTFPCVRVYLFRTCRVLRIISGCRILKLSGFRGISSTTSLQNHSLAQKP